MATKKDGNVTINPGLCVECLFYRGSEYSGRCAVNAKRVDACSWCPRYVEADPLPVRRISGL